MPLKIRHPTLFVIYLFFALSLLSSASADRVLFFSDSGFLFMLSPWMDPLIGILLFSAVHYGKLLFAAFLIRYVVRLVE